MPASRGLMRSVNSRLFRKGSGGRPQLKKRTGNLKTSHFEAGELQTDQPGNTIAWCRTLNFAAAGTLTVDFENPVVEGIAGQLIVTKADGSAVTDCTVDQIQVGAQALVHGVGGVSSIAFNADPQNEFPMAIAITNENKVAVTVTSASIQTLQLCFLPITD